MVSSRSIDPLEKAVARAMAENAELASETRSPEQDSKIAGLNRDVVADPEPATFDLNAGPMVGEASLEYEEIDIDTLPERNIVGHTSGTVQANVFTMLRAQVLRKLKNNGCRSLAVLGPSAGVGKSFVALNLALSMAKQRDVTVALLDYDLRKPSIANLLGVQREFSASDYLSGHCNLRQLGFRTQFDNLKIFAGQGGSIHAAELLANSRARRTVKELAPTPNTLVIVDLPPLCGIADVHTFLPSCDAALLVLEYAKTSKKELEESVRLIGDTPLVGSIVNRGQLSGDSIYSYGYGSVVGD